MSLSLSEVYDKLKRYNKHENYQGYDPCDTLNSSIPLQKFGKWIPILATQFQKRNPLNIRPLLGTKKGLHYYRENQFFTNSRSLWRIPRKWPVEIHNQSQGIITFIKLKEYDPSYKQFAYRIAEWTIENMQDEKCYFYHQIHHFYTIKIPYMRWSQAWMLLALTNLDYYGNEE